MGKYDAPAFVNHVLKVTKKDQLVWIGHSQGTTQFWLANTFYEDFGKKIKAMVAISPVAFEGNQ